MFRSNEPSLTQMVSAFTHIGMIVIQDNLPYILETHAADAQVAEGTFLHPFGHRLREYNGSIWIAPLKNTSTMSSPLNVSKYLGIQYDTDVLEHFYDRCLLGKSVDQKNTHFNCAQLVSQILVDLGIATQYDPCATPDSLAAEFCHRPIALPDVKNPSLTTILLRCPIQNTQDKHGD